MPGRDDDSSEPWMWEALARGELPSELVALLRLRAEFEPRVARRLSAYLPLSRGVVDRIVRDAERALATFSVRTRREGRG